MSGWIVRTLSADFFRDPNTAKAFVDDPDGFLSDRGLELEADSMAALKKFAEKAAGDVGAAGHVDVGSHANVNY